MYSIAQADVRRMGGGDAAAQSTGAAGRLGGPPVVSEERDAEAAQAAIAAGEGDEPTTAHVFGEQAGDLGELLESDSEDAVVDGEQAEHESAQPTRLGSSAGEPIEIDESEDGERVRGAFRETGDGRILGTGEE